MLAKKSLGQNFLTSIPARIAIVEAGHLNKDDTVLEIGPGKGFLTKALLDTGAHVVALEKDRDLLPLLNETFKSYKNFSLIEGDALTYEPENTPYKLIANIPYYITGAILSRYLSHNHQPSHMVVLIQKEVAERAVAKGKKESLLSLSIKVYGEPKIVYKVNKGSFNPIPKVDSAVLSIENISRNKFKNQYHEQLFFALIKAGFAHKRKLLISNIKEIFPNINWSNVFEENHLSKNIRAENVTLDTWLRLSLNIATQ